MATPSHAMLLRAISTAGDRERTGALDVAWDCASASLFFKLGRPRHVTFAMAGEHALAGGEALAALVAQLPSEIDAATWRRARVKEETLDLTADELIALFERDAAAKSNGHVSPRSEVDEPGATDPEPPPPAETPDPTPTVAMTDFPVLPLGPVLWSDAVANVLDLETMAPLLPDCLLVLTHPEPQAAALVSDGAITNALWMVDGQDLRGDAAARALMASTEGELTAYGIDDPAEVSELRTLLGEPREPATVAGDGAPTFDLESAAASEAGMAPMSAVPAAAPSSTLSRVGRHRSPLQVPIRVLLSLGIYALVWINRSNHELEEFDSNLSARPARSTLSGLVAWLAALLMAAAGAVLFATTRGTGHMLFSRQLTTREAYLLIAGLACLYIVLILPFNITAARTNLRRLRSVQERAGIAPDRLVQTRSALLLVIPVMGRLVLLTIEQRSINELWQAASPAPVDTAEPALDAAATGTAEEVASANADPVEEFSAIASEMEVVPVWFRVAAPPADEETQPEILRLAAPEPEPEPQLELQPEPEPEPEPQPQAEPEQPAAVTAQPEPAIELTAMEEVEARATTEFVQPRLDIDVDGLRAGLTDIAVRWLGAAPAAPVVAAVAAARPGVDDFVYAIAAIREMQIVGHESSTVRAMAREMHYYATEVLCAA